MKVNIVARPDHSILLHQELVGACGKEGIKLYTFFSLRATGLLSYLFPSLKRAPKEARVLYLYTFFVRVSNQLSRRFGYNRRVAEKRLFDFFSPQKSMIDCDVLHYWPFYSVDMARVAKASGVSTVAEYYEAEASFVNEILSEEYKENGLLGYSPSNTLIDQNEAFEFETDIIVASEYTKKSYLRLFPNKNIHICSYGSAGYQLVENVGEIIEHRKGEVSTKIVFVGQVCVEKGVHYLLEAIESLDVSLDIIGPIKAGQEHVFQSVYNNRKVNYIGPLRHSQVMSRLRGYDIFCLPSLSDNYSLAVVEALSKGIPVLITENCGNSKDVEDYRLGRVVKIKDSEGLSRAIENFKADFDYTAFKAGLDMFFSEDNKLAYPRSVYQVYEKIMKNKKWK